ncbi:MAG: ATP synthase F1 subunit gamma [Patescibacteria group bacterium]
MSLGTREIKRRIKSVANTKKITKAMELVAAAKMRKAVDAVLATRSYSDTAWNIVRDLSARTDPAFHPLLRKREGAIKKIGLILVASNRGLCGSFNRDIIDAVAAYMRHHKREHVDVTAEVLLMGTRGKDIMFRHGHSVVAEFTKVDVATRVSEVTPLSQMVIADYLAEKYDKVAIAYTDYFSAISQKPRIKQLLPIGREDTELGYVARSAEDAAGGKDFEFLFEPSPDAVLDQMLERLIELQVYQALLESNASEHSARMLAMRNASDAAGDMIDDLTLTFNQARQQAITSELADISAGSAAIK